MSGEVFREALRGIAVAIVRNATRYEIMVELFHLAPLKLLCHIDLISLERMGGRHHVADRAPPVRLGELDLASKREVFFGAAPAAFDGIFDKLPRNLSLIHI